MRRLAAAALTALLVAGCAHPWHSVNLPPGTPRAEVLERAGQPVREYPLPDGGRRLQYTLQPAGQYAFNVDLDAAGRLVRSQQVLTAANFQRIEPGRWTRADVEREFGPPARVDGVSGWDGPVYTYRWYDHGDMFHWVYFDRQDVVQRAHSGMDHVNAPNDARQ